MNPQDYSERKKYRPPAAWYRRFNRAGVWIAGAGLGPRDLVALAVRGRRTGRLRQIPILKTTVAGCDYLVSLAGESQWVRNLRHAGGTAKIRRGRRRDATLQELPPIDRPAIIAAYLEAVRSRSSAAAYAKQARFYFGLEPDCTREDVAGIAKYYPVFRIDYES